MSAIRSLHRTFLTVILRLQWFPALFTRLCLGWIFVESGWGKITAIDTVVKFFQDLNLPLPIFQAHLVAYTELIAGLLLIFGLFTRYAAIPLIVTMVVAIIKVAARDVEQVSGIIATSEFLYITLMIWLVVKGAGECSLDEYLRKKFR